MFENVSSIFPNINAGHFRFQVTYPVLETVKKESIPIDSM